MMLQHNGFWFFALMMLIVVSPATQAGNHHIESPGHRCVGCIDGSCGSPVVPFGHYRGSWRRFPGSSDTRFDHLDKPSTGAGGEPFVPEPVEELNSRSRTRSDRPLKPDEMLGNSGMAAPGAADGANPFNNTVDDSDLPTPNAGGEALNEALNDGFNGMLDPAPIVPDAGGGKTDPLFDNDFGTPDGGGGFGVPTSDGDAGPIDPFNETSLNLSSQPQRPLASRSIKSRGVLRLKRIDLGARAALPRPVTGPPTEIDVDPLADLVADASIGLASFQQTTQTTDLTRQAATQLNAIQPADPEVVDSGVFENSSSNPLRRRPQLRRSHQSEVVVQPSSTSKTAQGKNALTKSTQAHTPAKKPLAEVSNVDVLPQANESISSLVTTNKVSGPRLSSRAVKLRANPLRR